ncbi:MAG: hypothetical protein ACOH2V_13055 [Candidatus Saccharimonadaceae bacterium]
MTYSTPITTLFVDIGGVLLTDGDCVVFVGSTPHKLHGNTNMMKVDFV